MDLYLDESGDFGFTFEKPFRNGGSSRFMTFSFLLIPDQLSHLPRRIVRKLYKKKGQPPRIELKGRTLTSDERKYFAARATRLFSHNPEIRLFTVTIRKNTIKPAIRQDSGRLFDQVSRLGLLDKIKDAPKITFVSNPRSIRTKKGNHLADLLQTKLWFEKDADSIVLNSPKESLNELNLQFLDLIGHIVWKKYEDNETEAYDILKGCSETTPWWETLSGQW